MINEFKLKLVGTCNLTEPLVLNRTYDLAITNAECRKSEQHPNDDGTVNEQYTLKISEMSEILITFDKQTIKAKKKGSQSQALRRVIEQIADKLGKDQEKYYKEIMSKLIAHYQEKL